ncbi:MAG: hypothetical protein ABWZ98_14510 [Nakamurella sp.]
MARLITPDNLGAWLLRCNPAQEPELPRLVAGGGHRIKRWCVADNYRSQLMTAGDRVVFWVSGDGRQLTRGIWGVGEVLRVNGFRKPTGPDQSDDRAPVGPAGRPEVEVDIPLLTEALSDSLLRAAGIGDLEVQVQPQGANPSWVSTEQLARLATVGPGLFD